MAEYYLQLQPPSGRGKGNPSAVSKAAYINREKYYDERLGVWTGDYSKNHEEELLWSGIFVDKSFKPPDWVHDPEKLWNQVCHAETRKDALEYQDMILSLPHELTLEQQKHMLTDFIRENLTRGTGRVANAAIHAPSETSDKRNVHAHIMFTLRAIGEDGFEKKRLPRLTPADTIRLREKWAERGARELRKAGFDIEADRWAVGHLDNEKKRESAYARGDKEYGDNIRDEPQIHLGHDVKQMEARGIKTEKGDKARAIDARNAARREARKNVPSLEAFHEARAHLDDLDASLAGAMINHAIRNPQDTDRINGLAWKLPHEVMEGVNQTIADIQEISARNFQPAEITRLARQRASIDFKAESSGFEAMVKMRSENAPVLEYVREQDKQKEAQQNIHTLDRTLNAATLHLAIRSPERVPELNMLTWSLPNENLSQMMHSIEILQEAKSRKLDLSGISQLVAERQAFDLKWTLAANDHLVQKVQDGRRAQAEKGAHAEASDLVLKGQHQWMPRAVVHAAIPASNPERFAAALEDAGFQIVRVSQRDIDRLQEKSRADGPWMAQQGGITELSPADRKKAERSYQQWKHDREEERLQKPEGAILRLYRGEGAGGAALPGQAAFPESAFTGGWFTTDPEKAKRYGAVSFIDVTKEELMHFVQGAGGQDEWATTNPIFRQRMKPLHYTEQTCEEYVTLVQGAWKPPDFINGEILLVNKFGTVHRIAPELADQLKDHDRIVTLPEALANVDGLALQDRRGYTLAIQDAYRKSNNNLHEFVKHLADNEHGRGGLPLEIRIAQVTGRDAERSRAESELARKEGQFLPIFDEGQYVAVTERGQVSAFNYHTTGKSPAEMHSFLKHLGDLPGIKATMEGFQERAELRQVQMEVSIALDQGIAKDEEPAVHRRWREFSEKNEGFQMARGKGVLQNAERAIGKAGKALDAAVGVIGALADLITPVNITPAERRAVAEDSHRSRQVDAVVERLRTAEAFRTHEEERGRSRQR